MLSQKKYFVPDRYCTWKNVNGFCLVNSSHTNNTCVIFPEHLFNSSSITSNSILVMFLYLTASFLSRQTIIGESTLFSYQSQQKPIELIC